MHKHHAAPSLRTNTTQIHAHQHIGLQAKSGISSASTLTRIDDGFPRMSTKLPFRGGDDAAISCPEKPFGSKVRGVGSGKVVSVRAGASGSAGGTPQQARER